MLGKLIGLATIGGTIASVGMLHRFLSGIASIVMLAIVSGFMLCALLTGGFYLGYLGLVRYGLDPAIAGSIIGVIALIITVMLVTLTYVRLNRLREMSRKDLPSPIANPFDLTRLTTAFIDGFLNE